MLNKIFLQILNMSLTSSFVIIFVIIARAILKKSPKIFSYALWFIVLIRLLCPFSIESIFSIIPVNSEAIPQQIALMDTPKINTGIPQINTIVNPILPSATPEVSINPMQILIFIGKTIWILGIIIILIYSIHSLIKLKKCLKNAVFEKENIYISDKIDTAFVLGLVFPKIYLPINLSQTEKEFIIHHEKTHIKRLDHIAKLIFFIALTIHFFNPLVWISFILFTKDMEMACDESVIKFMGLDTKKEYSQTLLSISTRKHFSNGPILAFGEGNTKSRIKNVLNYKKAPFWIMCISVVIIIVLAFTLITSPKNTNKNFTNKTYKVEEIIYNSPVNSTIYTETFSPMFSITPDLKLYKNTADENKTVFCGQLYETELNKEEYLSTVFDAFEDKKEIENILDKTEIVLNSLDNTNSYCYYVFIQNNGDIYISEGNNLPNANNTPEELAKYVFKLEPLFESDIIETLYSYRTDYIGNASAVGNILQRLFIPYSLKYDGMELFTNSAPYGLRINYSSNAKEMNLSEESINLLEKNSIILFSLIGNLDYIEFVINNEVFLTKERTFANECINGNIYEKMGTIENFRHFFELLSTNNNLSLITKEIEIVSSTNGFDVESDYVRFEGNLSEEIFLQVDKTKGFSFNSTFDANPTVELTFGSSTPKNISVKHSMSNNNFEEISLQENKIIVPLKDGTHYFLCNITWEDLSTENILFKANIVNGDKEIILPNYTYDGKDKTLKLVYDTINMLYSNNSSDSKEFEIYYAKVYGEYEEENMLKIITVIDNASYTLYGDELKLVSGGLVPAAITYEKEKNGDYKFVDITFAKDGSYWESSIKDFCTYPVSNRSILGLGNKIINDYASDDFKNSLLENLIEHLKKHNISRVRIVKDYSDEVEILEI